MANLRYILKRGGYLLITAFFAITLNFLIPRLMPGNPAVFVLLSRYGNRINPHELNLVESQLHLTGSLWSQYVGYMSGLFHGNLGVSYFYYPESVSQIIATHLPWTLFLLGTATVISVIIGVSIASYIGWRLGGKSDSLISAISMSLGAIPFFWLGLIFQVIFGVMITVFGFHLFPVAHGFGGNVVEGPNIPFILSVLHHAFLPLITLILISFPSFALLMRNTISTIINEDYVLMARAKGLRTWRLKKFYVNKNAKLPVATSVALALGSIVGGAFLVEVVFSYPGIGYVLYNAVTTKDFPLIDGIFLVITFTVMIANFLVDILYSVLDPRVVLQ